MAFHTNTGRPRLDGLEVHVWIVQLLAGQSDCAKCLSWLSRDECLRASRFRFERDRQEFILSHGILRGLLSYFEEKHPAQLQFSFGMKGKPALRSPSTPTRFNMAHSGGLAVYAFTAGIDVGVDLERVRDVPQMEADAARFFSREEGSDLFSLPPTERTLGFYRCWTRKEAYIKAVGDGLWVPLSSFRVAVRPDKQAALLSIGGDVKAAENWHLHDLALISGYVGALAYEGPLRALHTGPIISAGELLDEEGFKKSARTSHEKLIN